MLEWLAENPWSVWLVLAMVLATVESMTLDFTLIMLAIGAAAGAVVAVFLPGLIGVQAIVAAGVAVSTLFLLRPSLLRRFRSAPGYRSQFQKLVGSEGVALTEITGAGGEVKVNGETWSARPYGHSATIAKGEVIEVFQVDGVTALVHPRDELMP